MFVQKNPYYAQRWAEKVLERFVKKYTRVHALLYKIYGIEDKELIKSIQGHQKRWEDYKRCCKYVHGRKKKLYYPQDEHVIRTCLQYVMSDYFAERFPLRDFT